mmetsp:Transcript_29962/g.41168  ORF Transcript_29962/g.41168 Transcript_29962/m.41168 type:complete len:228 (-) Transcript_29962:59-742(-)
MLVALFLLKLLGGDLNLKGGAKSASLTEVDITKYQLKLPIVVTEEIELSLNDFSSLFVIDNAPYGIHRYHESVKDKNVTITNWTVESCSISQVRQMDFFKPVNLPGLSSTRGTKFQSANWSEDFGLILRSSTRLKDVPYADSFTVDDVLMVQILTAKSVKVSISFQVTFTKSTMLGFIIEANTNREMSHWLRSYFAHLKHVSELFKTGVIDLKEQSCSTNSSNPIGT